MYIDDAGGAMIGATIGKSMDGFAASAKSGGFAVSEQGGEALLKAIYEMADWVDGQSFELDMLAQQARLGSTNNAEAMKPYLHDVATDQQGLITQLKEFRKSLVQAEEGIKAAMANYRKTDGLNAVKFA